jgi:hypothetical protein
MTKVTVFKQVWDTNNPYIRSLEFCLNRIKNGDVRDKVEKYRLTLKDEDKRELSGVCFNGRFKTREAKGLLEPSGFMVLDFDKFETREEAIEFREQLRQHDFIYCAFISPSAKGVKALAKIPKDPDNFKLYYNAIEKHFDTKHFDKSGKDLSRFCFESYDPDLWINKKATTWDTIEEEEYENIGKKNNEVVVPMASESNIIDNLQKWFDKKYNMDKGNRNNNLFIFAMALNDFGINKDTAERVCLQYVTNDFKQSEIEQLVQSAYKRGIATKGTKHFEDNKLKQNIHAQILNGMSEKDIMGYLETEQIAIKDIKQVIDKVKKTTEVSKFWYYDKKGKLCLSVHSFKFWLEQNNFMKFYPTKSKTYTFIKKDQNFIEETNERLIKDFVLSRLLEGEQDTYAPYDFMALNTKFFTTEFLSFLKSAEIKLKEDTQEKAYIYYQNCAVEVTDEKVTEIDYLNLDGYVWKNQIIDRDYKVVDHHPSVFREFIWLISGRDVEKYNSFKSVIGYLLHSYKTSANNRAIIFNDETISENPNGGSGKGLFWNALSKMKKVSMIDGKTFEFTKSFPYQTVSTDCQILVFDDVKKNFNFESLFSLITEGITLEYKNQDAIKLPVQKSPKILITTNYTVGGVGGSFERRKFEVEFSSYFGAHNTPLDHFKHLLFDEWDIDEWARFDAYMINCLQYFLQNGLQAHEFNNLELRKFIKETSSEFYEFIKENRIPLNHRNYKGKTFEDFTLEYQDFKKWLSQKKFKKWLDLYAKFIDAEYVEGVSQDGRWYEIRTKEQPMPFNNNDDITDIF